MRLIGLVAVVVVVVVAVVFFGIGQAYRSDEVWSLQTVGRAWPDMMGELRADIHPPLYYILLRGWVGLFGDSELASRSLSVLMHLLAAGVLFAAARSLFGQGGGELASVVLVVSPLGLLVAQFVRMYALLELAAALSTAAFLRAESTRGRLALYIAANVLGTFVHVWFFFLLGAQIAVAIVLRRWKTAGAAMASVAPYAVLWLSVVLSQFRQTGQGLAWLTAPGAFDLLGAVLMQGGAWWLLAPVVAVAAWRYRARQDRDGWVLWALWAVTILVPFALSFVKPVFWARFTVVAVPALALAAAAVTRVTERRVAAVIVLGLGAALQAGQVTVRPEQCNSRWTADWLAQNTHPGDLVVYTNLSRLATDFYWDRRGDHADVLERSYPVAVDSHPGFEGVLDSAVLRREAQNLPIPESGKRVFLLHGTRAAADDILLPRLKAVATLDGGASVACTAGNNYYSRISVFQVR